MTKIGDGFSFISAGSNMKKYAIFLLILVFSSLGCQSLQKMDELLTLKDLAEDQEGIDQYVESQDALFKQMHEACGSAEFVQLQTKAEFGEKYGEPVYVEQGAGQTEWFSKWLYRKTVDYFGTERVVLYFDKDGNLVKYECQ